MKKSSLLNKILPGRKPEPGGTPREFCAEALEARILYSAAPVEVAPQETDHVVCETNSGEGFVGINDFLESSKESASQGGGAGDPGSQTGLQNLSETELATLIQAAEQYWIESGIDADQLAALKSIDYKIIDLENRVLGKAEGDEIQIDIDAAGEGWFIDITPFEHEEFGVQQSLTALRATEGDAANGIDLLSVLIHEQGHVLGLVDTYEAIGKSNVMYGFFDEGERRLAADGQAAEAEALSLNGAHFAEVPLAGDDGNATDQDTVITVSATDPARYENSVNGDDPVVYYRLNESSGSSEAVDQQGSSTGTATSVTFGESGILPGADPSQGSAEFDKEGKITIEYDPSLNPAGSFSFEVWVDWEGSSGYQSVITSRGGNGEGYILYKHSNGKWSFWTSNGGANWDQMSAPMAAASNEPTYLVGTFEADGAGLNANGYYTGTKILYINGVEVARNNSAFYKPNGSSPTHIGAGNADGSDYYFDGHIDEVAIYDKALTAEGVAERYNLASRDGLLSNDTFPEVSDQIGDGGSENGNEPALINPDSVTLNEGSAFYSEDNLVGQLTGLDLSNYEAVTFESGSATSWVTGVVRPDYFGGSGVAPVLTFNLDSVQSLTHFVYWGYGGNSNEAKDFTLEFSADNGATFSDPVNISSATMAGAGQNTFFLGAAYEADTVRVTITDNFGGNRVGLGEVKFISKGTLEIVAVNGDHSAVGNATLLPSGAEVTVASDGSYSYDPNNVFDYLADGETTTDSFSYTINDGYGNSSTATVTITITGTNDTPSLTGFANAVDSTNEDTGVEITFNELAARGDEADVDGAVSGFVVKSISSGTLTIGGIAFDAETNNTISSSTSAVWTPGTDDNGNGINAFTVVAIDEAGAESSTPVQVTVDVTAVNDTPGFTVTASHTSDEDEGAQSVANFASNITPGASNENSQNLTFEIVSNDNLALFASGPSISDNGTLTYTATANAFGSANIEIRLKDDEGGENTSETQSFTITINPINDSPVAGNSNFTLSENGDSIGNLLMDGDGNGIHTDADDNDGFRLVHPTEVTLSEVAPYSNINHYQVGNLVNDFASLDVTNYGDATFTSGTATSWVTNSTGAGTSYFTANGTSPVLTFELDSVESLTHLVYWGYGGNHNEAKEFILEFSADGGATFSGPVTVSSASMAGSGQNTLFLGGAYDADMVKITITDNYGGNRVGLGEVKFISSTFDVVAVNGENSAVGQPLTLPSGAEVIVQPDGSYQYNTNGVFDSLGSGQTTTDSFTFTISDEHGGTSTATVTVTIEGTNDAPSLTGFSSIVDSTDEDTGVEITFADLVASGDEADIDGLVAGFVVKAVTSGSLTIGGVAFDVVTNNTISSTTSAVWTPDADVFGAGINAFTVVAVDDVAAESTIPVQVTVNVSPVNDTPAFTITPSHSSEEDAGIQSVANFAGGLNKGAANESDQNLTFEVVSNNNATLFESGPTISADGTLTYTAAANASGSATIDVRVKDGGGGADTSSIQSFTIEITPVNDAPVAIADNGSTGENETASFDVISNDVDVDEGATLTVDSIGPVTVSSANSSVNGIDASGAFSIDASGRVAFDPGALFDPLLPGETATVAVQYTVKDEQGATGVSTLIVTVNGAAEAPETVNPIEASEVSDPFAGISSLFTNLDNHKLFGSLSRVTATVTNAGGGFVDQGIFDPGSSNFLSNLGMFMDSYSGYQMVLRVSGFERDDILSIITGTDFGENVIPDFNFDGNVLEIVASLSGHSVGALV
ncbi:MAG: tandem-95 repeat protein [Verrucomicrobiales bacterium]|nr:tandem-95 repeat protein [Verrucomicrobiales bacterium]